MILWELARSSGFVALGALTATMLWGMLLAGRALRPAAPGLAAHRFLSALALAAIATHVGALLLDAHAHVSPAVLAGDASPPWLAGVVALWIAVALPVSVALRARRIISTRVWRQLHRLAYAAWVLAWAHGLAAGTDTGSPWAIATYATGAGLVVAAGAWRWLGDGRGSRPARAGISS